MGSELYGGRRVFCSYAHACGPPSYPISTFTAGNYVIQNAIVHNKFTRVSRTMKYVISKKHNIYVLHTAHQVPWKVFHSPRQLT